MTLTQKYDADRHLLEIRGLATNFETEAGTIKAVDDVDLYVDEGETLGLVLVYASPMRTSTSSSVVSGGNGTVATCPLVIGVVAPCRVKLATPAPIGQPIVGLG